MAVTKSWEATEELTTSITTRKARVRLKWPRLPGAFWLLCASLAVACGFVMKRLGLTGRTASASGVR